VRLQRLVANEGAGLVETIWILMRDEYEDGADVRAVGAALNSEAGPIKGQKFNWEEPCQSTSTAARWATSSRNSKASRKRR
jgi:hypothetical protein